MVFYAPTVNSYKRYVDASWAPTRLAWSYDNRTAGFRVVGDGPSLRIECRIPGADCNPYLALAASLASGLDGIANRIEPPECFVGDVYAARRPAARAVHPARGGRRVREQRIREGAPSARTSSSTTPTSSAPRQRPSTKRSPTGNAAEYFERIYETQRQGRAHHRRRQRHRPAGGRSLFASEGAAVVWVDVNEQAAPETVDMIARSAICR